MDPITNLVNDDYKLIQMPSGLRLTCPALEVEIAEEDISKSVTWKILDSRNRLIAHLGGWMETLTTELSGFRGSFGPATPGEIWTVPANTNYVAKASGARIKYAVLSFGPDSGAIPTNLRTNAMRFIRRAGFRDDWLIRELWALENSLVDGREAKEVELLNALGSIVRHVIKNYATGADDAADSISCQQILTPLEVEKIQQYVQQYLSSDLSLDDLAPIARMTTHQFLIAFKARFDTTPAQYIIGERLRRAQWLMLHSRSDITSIAHATGFNSHSHLTSAFTKRFGYPPQRFRSAYSRLTTAG